MSRLEPYPSLRPSLGALAMLLVLLGSLGCPKAKPTGSPGGNTAAPVGYWTIHCATFTDQDHIARSKQLKDELLAVSGMKEWRLTHTDQDSVLSYGKYRNVGSLDGVDATRAREDRRRITAMVNGLGDRLFPNCALLPEEDADPDSPREWNLASAKGVWSVQIGAYRGSPDRRKVAVESVAQARKEGLPAFYYHGPTVSSVCVGIWPEESVRVLGDDEVRASSPRDLIMVTNIATPEKLLNREGQRVRVTQKKVEIVDQELRATFRKFPYHLTNGEAVKVRVKSPTGQVTERMDRSFLVRVPSKVEGTFIDIPSSRRPDVQD